MEKRVLFIGIMSFISVMLHQVAAVPAVPWLVEKQQPDGSKISVYIRGDERVNWMESPDGYTLMYDSGKSIVYAEQDFDGNMIPSRVKFTHSQTQSSVPFKKGLRYSSSQVSMLKQIWEMNVSNNLRSAQRSPVTGAKKTLCVLMGFPDKAFSKTLAEFESLMNQVSYSVGTARGSVKDFFLENSYGEMDLTVTVAGPYQTSNNLFYYVSLPNDAGYQYFAKEAIEKANADPNVDLSEFANASNELESFHIIYAGYGDEAIGNKQQIWAHKWQLATPITLNGVKVSVYSCSPELRGNSGTTLTGIGVICHEMNHTFGSPDYYDIDYSGYTGSGQWDLMSHGSWNGNGDTPAHINIFQKMRYDWVKPVELSSYTEVKDMLNSTENPVAYSIDVNATGEMYLLENRQQVKFDVGVPGHGLLIWHIHKDASTTFAPNDKHPQQVYPVVASSSVAIPNASSSAYGQINTAGTPFPGTSGKTSFTDISVPQAFTWDGLTGIGNPVTSISETDNKISFTFMEAAPDPVVGLQADIEDENTVILTWTASEDKAVIGYKIFRDNVLLGTISGRTDTTYIQTNVPNKTYEYCVVAMNNKIASAKTCTSVPIAASLAPVTNFQAIAVNADTVVLSWTPSISAKVSGYKIYRDNILQYTISGRTSNTYTQFNVSNGTYVYGIVAFDVVLESNTVYDTAIVTGSTDDYCSPAFNLKTYSLEDKVLLQWDAPFGKWTSMANESIYGLSYNRTAIFGKKWSANDLRGMNGFVISKIQFAPFEMVAGYGYADYTVVIYSVPSNGIPQLVYQQPVVQSLSLSQYNEVLLNTPVEIDASKEWIVGIRYDLVSGSEFVYTMAYVDSNDPRDVFYDTVNGWTALQSLVGTKYTYCLKVYFDVFDAPSFGNETSFAGYNIYRDEQLITTLNGRVNEYIDEMLDVNTTYTYCVSAVYNNCVSEPVCAEVITHENSIPDPEQYCLAVTNLTASATAENISLNWNAPQRAGWFSISGDPSIISLTFFTPPIKPLEIGVLWRPEDLQGLHGFRLTKVKFAPYNGGDSNVKFSIVVYKTTEFGTMELVYCQALVHSVPWPSPVTKEFVLDTPVEIDASQNWIVGIRFEGTTNFVSDDCSDDNPRNLIRYGEGDWYTMGSFFENFDRNFYFEMYLDDNGSPASPVVFSNRENQLSVLEKLQARMPEQKVDISSVPVSRAIAGNIQRAAASITGYSIVRDSQLLTTVSPGNLIYTDYTVKQDTTYTYCISANYSSGCSSDPVCVEVTTKAIAGGYIPVDNLQMHAGISLKDRQIKWEEPNGTLQYCKEDLPAYVASYGNNSVAVRFPKEELRDKSGSRLTKISYCASQISSNPATANAFLCVWKGKNATRPEILVYEQAIPAIASYFTYNWHELLLTTPVDVYGDEDLWIGMRVGDLQVYMDSQPNVQYGSRVYSAIDDAWIATSSNLLLKGYLESKENIMSYSVFRDNQLIDSVNANTFSYSDRNLVPGNHNYCVTAVYETGSSEARCLDTFIEAGQYNPVSDLQVSLAGTKDVDLTWKAPDTAEETLLYCSNIASGWWGGAIYSDFTYAVCFPSEELSAMHGFQLTKVSFMADATSSNLDINLCVWRGKNSNNEPDRLVYEQSVSNFTLGGNWCDILLNEPIELDPNEDFWIGIHIHSQTSGILYALGYNIGQDIPQYRNMQYVNEVWSPYSGNWLISGKVSPKDNLLSYSISKNTAPMVSLGSNILSYIDIDPGNGLHEYCVTADYTTGSSKAVCESIQIGDPVGVEIPRGDIFVYCKDQIIYTVSTKSDPIRQIEIYNLQGKRIYWNDQVNAAAYTIHNNISLSEICIVRLITETRVINAKIIK